MFTWSNKELPYRSTGTTPPLYIPRDLQPKQIRPGEDYFFVQVKAAQAAFTGPIWERVKSLIVTSQVAVNHPVLGTDPLRAIQRSIVVQRNHAEQLGMSPNLIKLIPAVMSNISISIEFILDKENQLSKLGSLINDDSFFAAISLAPGAAMIARTIGGLSQKILQTFFKSEERQPILQFSGDFNISGGLADGYYAILGTRDESHPIPNPLPELKLSDTGLLADGQRITQLSYIVLDMRSVSARTRDLSDGAAWDVKLNQAEAVAMGVFGNPLVGEEERKQAWQACLALLKEAQILLLADPNYLNCESQNIIKAAYANCYTQIFGVESRRNALAAPAGGQITQVDLNAARALLSIPLDEDLGDTLDSYAEQVIEARNIFRAAGSR